jgi:SAM-dependent methyltransferase
VGQQTERDQVGRPRAEFGVSYSVIADCYEIWSAHETHDIPFYVELAREAEGPLVELGVGTGRVAVAVAQATGKHVIGLDLSASMLEQAQQRAARAGVELDLRQLGMQEIALDEPAGLVYAPFGALLHLPTWNERRRTFERVAASLRPDGRFAWNAVASDHRLASRLHGRHKLEPVPHTSRFTVGDNRMDIIYDDRGSLSLWFASKNEWLGLIDVAGLEIEELYGDVWRRPFTETSTEYVFITRRRSTIDSPAASQMAGAERSA